jgi:conjugative relaxase-like TrwC/TraI family protein
VLTISPGHSVEYLTREVAAGRENYYTGAVTEGEPPGRWYGTGAATLGLTGLVDHEVMAAVYDRFLDPRDPGFGNPDGWDGVATLGHAGRRYLTAAEIYQRSVDAEPDADPERREQLRLDAARKERRNVAFLDVTFSVPKSVTVLHAAFEAQEVKARTAGGDQCSAAWAAHKRAVEDAIWAGNNAGLDYLQQYAGYSRVGHHGGAAGRFIDAHSWTVASFFQHTSRTNDPQLHIHNAVLSRVECADGAWRTVDGRSLYLHRPAAAAVAERAMFEHLAGSMRIRAATRPDGKSREIPGIPAQATELFSARRRAITPKTAQLVTAFEQRYGRPPNALETDRLQRQATLATRPRKSHTGETLEQRLDRMEHTLRAELDLSLDRIAAHVLSLADTDVPAAESFDVEAVLQTAIADVQASRATWTRADLTRAVNDALPDYLGGLDPHQIQHLLTGLTGQAITAHGLCLTAQVAGDHSLPAELRLADGASAYHRPGSTVYATADHLRAERSLRDATVHRSAARLIPQAAARFLAGVAQAGVELGADQRTAVAGILTSGAGLECLVGPAGTGKSFVLGVVAQAWTGPGHWPDHQARRVVGLAASQIATTVLAEEGIPACNIARWLAAQQRLADNGRRAEDEQWRLGPGDLVVVDESAMADTAALTHIHGHVRAAGAKLLLTGDHRQLAAVGPAGGMHLTATTGISYELTEARRFSHEWERAASLQLRDGNDTALTTYRKHGRIIDAGPAEAAEHDAARAWLADTLTGHRALLIVDTNEAAARLSALLRAELVRLGKVAEAGVPLQAQGTVAGVGDLIQARRNGWHLAG